MSARRATLRADGILGSGWEGGWAGVPDDSLVHRARTGSHEAFGELARRHRPTAIRTAASIIGSERAEDVVQDALILAFRALGMLHDPGRFPQWLGTITRYRAMRVGRRESRRNAGLVAIDTLPNDPPARPEEDPGLEASDVPRLEAALLQIPAAFADVLRLHFLHGLPHLKIAERLGVSLSTSKWRCFRGKQLLREVLRPNDPAAARVESACARCSDRTDGARCEELSSEAGGSCRKDPLLLPSVPPAPGAPRAPRRPTSGVLPTPRS